MRLHAAYDWQAHDVKFAECDRHQGRIVSEDGMTLDSTVATSVQALVAVAMLFLSGMIWWVYRQQRNIMAKQNKDTNFLEVGRLLQAEDMRESRAKIMAEAGKGHAEIEKAHTKVLSGFELAAQYAQHGLIEKSLLEEVWGPDMVTYFGLAPDHLKQPDAVPALKVLVNDLQSKGVAPLFRQKSASSA